MKLRFWPWVMLTNIKEEERASNHVYGKPLTTRPRNDVEKRKCANEPFPSLTSEYSLQFFYSFYIQCYGLSLF